MKLYVILLLILFHEGYGVQRSIIIWDNDGTIMGSKDPNDSANFAKIILPNIEKIMRQANTVNIVCSGMKTVESELQNFDPIKIIVKFKQLMTILPIDMVTFSPAIGGTECWVILKKNTEFEIRKVHEDKRYKHLIGQFKKPDIGMLVVIKDCLKEQSLMLHDNNTVFIGDAQQDKLAAQMFGIPFIWAQHIHQLSDNSELLNMVSKSELSN